VRASSTKDRIGQEHGKRRKVGQCNGGNAGQKDKHPLSGNAGEKTYIKGEKEGG